MLNETCSFKESTGFVITHIVSSSISIPVYFLAFFILLFKSPEHFQSYRNYLAAHILSGFLMDIHMNYIWRVNIVLPIPIMCSNSFTAEYAPIVFQLLPFCIIFTGISVVSLFVYRMEAVILHRIEITKLRKSVYYSRNLLYVTLIFLAIFSILMYPALKYQKDYKTKMEERFGKFQPYMWCDNCFFMNFDSKIFLIFYAFCVLGIGLCFYCCISALVVTIKILNSIKSKLSHKTAEIHRNFLQSLVFTTLVHIICILIPLLGVFVAISVMVRLSQLPYLPYILTMILQEHGAASTVTMFLTNNLLRKTMRRMLPFKFKNNATIVHNVPNSGADSRYF